MPPEAAFSPPPNNLDMAPPARAEAIPPAIAPNINHLTRSEERFSRNAETDIVCRLLLEKKNSQEYCAVKPTYTKLSSLAVQTADWPRVSAASFSSPAPHAGMQTSATAVAAMARPTSDRVMCIGMPPGHSLEPTS